MLERKNAVVFVAAENDACALWRLYFPHISLPGSAFFHFRSQRPDFEKIAGHDIIVVQRCCTNAQFELLRACKQLGMKIVFDLDDNVWEVPEANPAFHAMRAYREGFITCIRMVDVVTVSTPRLALVVKKNVREMKSYVTGREIPIVVCRNRMEERLFVEPLPPSDPPVVGWGGSSSHVEDLELITPAVVECAQKFPEAVFEYRGYEPRPDHPVRALANWRHRLWTPVAEYSTRMPLWGWAVALAPVTDHYFNASKSPIKQIEAGYCGIPCLASYEQPYTEFVKYDRELKWLLCSGRSNFRDKLEILLRDEALRRDLGERMRRVVLEHYTFRTPHEGWDEAFGLARAA